MKLFEDAWVVKNQVYLREFNTDTQKSEKRAVKYNSEYYLKDPLGKYKSFLDRNVTLRKVQGSSYNVDDAYGSRKGDYCAIREEHFGHDTYNKKPGTWFLDIETAVGTNSTGFPQPSEALEPITLIQFFDTKTNKGYVLGLEEWYYQHEYSYDFDLEYIKCDTEKELLNKYINLFTELNPFLIYAWSGNNFDFPYLFNRFKRLRIKTDKLSVFGKVNLKTKKLDNGQIINELESTGHWYCDMMDVYKKFVFDTVPSYSLDFIGEKETGTAKVDHSNYIKFDDFRTGKYKILGHETEEEKSKKIYRCAKALERDIPQDKKDKLQEYIKKKSYSEFVHYGVIDFVILKGIEESRNFTSLMVNMSEMMGCKLPDTLGTLKAWDTYIGNVINKDKLVTPPKQKTTAPNIVGGYVRDPEKGKQHWILSSDVASMYPLLSMAAFNMSAETFVPVEDRPKELQDIINKFFYDQNEETLFDITEDEWKHIREVTRKYNVALGVNGSVFTKESQGVMPKLVTDIYKERKVKKKEMWKFSQEALNFEEEYKKTPTPEIKEKIDLAHYYKQLMDTAQMTLKISINSIYGAQASNHFSLYNESIAGSITGNGRYFIRMLANNVEDKLQQMLPSKSRYIVAGDTDSCVGSTIVNTSEGNVKIEDLFNTLPGELEIRGEENFVKHLKSNITAKSFNTKDEIVEDKRIKYVMKHKVKKRMFKIKHKDKEVIITEDHSVIIKRGMKYLDVKPGDIQKADEIIIINKIH